MEIKQYLFLARKWAWLVILGAVVGAAFSYYYSSRQPTIYQTQTRIMVSRATEDQGSNYYIYNDVQLAKTYAQLINTGPVMDALSEKLGYAVSSGQIRAEQVADSFLLRITVTDGDPLRAAEIANGIVDVFIDYNENLQVGRYQASEETLQAQITQVESQIDLIQSEMLKMTEQTQEIQLQERQEQFQERLNSMKNALDDTERQIIALENQISVFSPTPVPGPPVPSWQRTPTPLPTPTLSPEQVVQLKESQNSLEQLQSLRDLYRQTYTSLLVMGDTNNTNTDNSQQRQEQLQTTLALYQQIYSNLLNNYEAVRLARLRSTPNVAQIEPAPVPDSPIQPQPMQGTLMGAVIGAVLMGGLAFLIEYLDDTLKTPEDITHFLRIPVIGLIGEMGSSKGKEKKPLPGVFVFENPLSPVTEAFRSLRTNLEFAGVDKPLKTLLITSASPSEGKSTVSVNLAAAIAQGERSVVLVDADLRRPSVHRYLDIPNRHGLSDVFRDQSQLANVITSSGSSSFSVITSGSLPPNPSELLASERIHSILRSLEERFDMVIIDSPPVIVTDPITLASKVDGVLLVIEPGKTKIGAAQVVMEQMQRAGARVVGAVLNPISRRRANYYSKYRYYSAYYYYSRGYNRYVSNNGSNGSNGTNGRVNGKVKTQETQPISKPDERKS